MNANYVNTIRPLVARIRASDIPTPKGRTGQGSRFTSILIHIKSNLVAGLAPGEALEIHVPDDWKNSSAVNLLGKLRKMVAENHFPVECFKRNVDNKLSLYIVGQL